jgi:hypothetical protein
MQNGELEEIERTIIEATNEVLKRQKRQEDQVEMIENQSKENTEIILRDQGKNTRTYQHTIYHDEYK